MFPTFKLVSAATCLALLTIVRAKTDAVLYRGTNCQGNNVATTELAPIGNCAQLVNATASFQSLQFFTNGETQCFNWYRDAHCQNWIVETQQRSNDCENFVQRFGASSILRVPC